ncbi:MAG: NADPH-dependent oxidoreductase [Betaproteobacteria bacterium]|nr:NADPH-dependent oxidoreductase [Betaproteobacteria bacterium]
MKHFSPTSLFEERYGKTPDKTLDAAPPIPTTFNGTWETILSHRSVRSFLETPLPSGTLEWLIAAAQSAPSSCNLQLWSVVAVEDNARKARLADCSGQQDHVKQAPLLLVFLADMAMLHDFSSNIKTNSEGIDYIDIFLMAVMDATLAAQNIVIAAESMKLGTVYCGSIRNHPEEVIRELNLPPHVFPMVGLSVGYPDPERLPRIKPRLSQRAVLHRERYSNDNTLQAIADYDVIMSSFYRAYREGVTTWSKQSLARLHGPESLAGRDRLKEAILKQGILLK